MCASVAIVCGGGHRGALEPLLEAGESYADLSVERLIQAADISCSTFYGRRPEC
jgi:hypothetical protein